MLDTILTRPAVLAPALIIIGYLLYHLVFKPSIKLPSEFPIIGAKDGDWFPILQAKWRNTTNFKATLHLAETQFRNQPVILPLLGVPNLILLPRSDIDFVQQQDRSVLDLRTETDFRLQLNYTSPNPDLMNLHEHIVQNKWLTDTLTSQVGALIPAILEETAYTLDKHWGTPTDWTSVGVYQTTAQMLALVSNRAFVGTPTNRIPKLTQVGMKYAVDLPLKSAIIRCLWTPISPLVAYLLTIPVRRYAREFEKILEPEITRRIALYDAKHNTPHDPENKTSTFSPEPNDAIQWILNSAKATNNPLMWKPSTIADRILILNFASIHTSDYALTQTIIELAWSKQEYLSQLRAEIETCLAETNNQWTKRAVAKMVKLDSSLRESSRLNSFQPAGLGRVVMSPHGVKTPSSGEVIIPQGASVVVPAYNAHRDPTVYPDPETFHPFRFVDQGSSEKGVKSASSSYVNTGCDYLAFGSGKYACTGRFFAAVELKVMLAYIILNYDIDVQEGCRRPESRWVVWNVIMPLDATIRVRKRVVGGKAG